ncbi:MAG: thiamine-phosphate kinase [Armatimonadetes bacterium]|nr:thiamine-phosphate kinase [Armatimonadota bacterium]
MRESDLIARIARIAGAPPDSLTLKVATGIGDDCAVLRIDGRTLLLTVDMLVEGVHFRLDWTDAHALGWKALAVNLSDIAAMGGKPEVALFSFAAPPHLAETWLPSLVSGLTECARQYGCALVGGDSNRAERVVLDITVLGTVEGAPLLRSGAQPGDWLMVTGALGGSRAGLYALLEANTQGVDLTPHLKPVPRLREGQFARVGGASAMMDLSDGLAADLPKLLQASRVGATVFMSSIPIHPVAHDWAISHGEDPALFAILGGEDYELLFTAPPNIAENLASHISAETGTPVTRIGEITAEPALWLEDETGQRLPWTFQGWDHFG